VVIEKNKSFQCENCLLWYEEKDWADRCETWCNEHDSCNLQITLHSTEAIKKMNKE
jgi:hypothetical protein